MKLEAKVQIKVIPTSTHLGAEDQEEARAEEGPEEDVPEEGVPEEDVPEEEDVLVEADAPEAAAVVEDPLAARVSEANEHAPSRSHIPQSRKHSDHRDLGNRSIGRDRGWDSSGLLQDGCRGRKEPGTSSSSVGSPSRR